MIQVQHICVLLTSRREKGSQEADGPSERSLNDRRRKLGRERRGERCTQFEGNRNKNRR